MASIDAIGCGSPQDAAAALTAAIANTQKAASNGSLVRLTSDLRRAESAETPTFGTDAFSSLRAAVRKAFSATLTDTIQDMMDDSGRSVQPFLVEGDSLFLQLLCDDLYDTDYSGQVLYFIYKLEKAVARLTEGHREMHVVFFAANAAVWAASPFLQFLRSAVRRHMRDVLRLHVYDFANVDDAFVSYVRRETPLFIATGDGVTSAAQAARIQALAGFGLGTSALSVDLLQLEYRLKAEALSFARRSFRCVRLPELICSDGMLRGLSIRPHPALFSVVGEPAFPAEPLWWNAAAKAAPAVDAAATQALADGFATASKELAAAGLPQSPRLALVIAGASRLLAPQSAVSDAVAAASGIAANPTTAAAHAALIILQALLLEDLPLSRRALSKAAVDAAEASVSAQSKALRASMLRFYGEMLPLVGADSDVVSDSKSDAEAKHAGADAAADAAADAKAEQRATIAAGLFDLVDGRLLHRILLLHLSGEVVPSLSAGSASGKAAAAAWGLVCRVAGLMGGGKIDAFLGKLTGPKPVFAADAAAAATGALVVNGSSLQESWEALPPIDTQMSALMLHLSTSENAELAAKIAAATKDSAASAAAAAAATGAAHEAKTAAAASAAPEEPADDWETADEPADDWETADVDEPAAAPAAASSSSAAAAAAAADAAASAASAAAGPAPVMDFKTAEDANTCWGMSRSLPDGASVRSKYQEKHVSANPIRVTYYARPMLLRLMDNNRDRDETDMRKMYKIPADKEFKALEKMLGGMTWSNAREWYKNQIEIKIQKSDNRSAIKAQSTKDVYAKSMKTPSKTILRDIVATQLEGEESSGDEAPECAGSPSSASAAAAAGGLKPKPAHAGKGKAGAAAGGKGGFKGPAKEGVAERALRENAERAAEASMLEVRRFIALQATLKLSADQKIDRLDAKLLDHSDMPSALYGLMELLALRVAQWRDRVDNRVRANTAMASTAATEAQMEVAVRLYQLIADLSRRFLTLLSVDQADEIARALSLLGFNDMAVDLITRHAVATGSDVDAAKARAVTLFGKSVSTSERRYAVGMSRSRFLLAHAGHTLLRNVKSARDPRVSAFFPDKWQRKLLDIVDSNESALVVAPTSAGKTLVSFYAVDHVARLNKTAKSVAQKGVVVFIAPTFPLARQMEADILCRTSASVHVHNHHLPLPSQLTFDVLVTVPDCMETLLLSPERMAWVKRIKYVVFDEVHSIGSTLAGPMWERLFLLIHHAPFLALSATVGGADRFHDWLKRLRAAQPSPTGAPLPGAKTTSSASSGESAGPSPIVHKVVTSIRWSHLHHYFYVPSSEFLDAAAADAQLTVDVNHSLVAAEGEAKGASSALATAAAAPAAAASSPSSASSSAAAAAAAGTPATGLPSIQTLAALPPGTFLPLHPCATVTFEDADKRTNVSLLANVEFSTADTLELYDAMIAVAEKSPRMKPGASEAALLQSLKVGLNPDTYFGFYVEKLHTLEYEDKLKAELGKWHARVLDTELLAVVDSLGSNLRSVLEPLTKATAARREKWIAEFLPLVRQLQEREWFPAIMFCLDRTLCIELCERLVADLEAQETARWAAEKDPRLDKAAMIKENERLLKLQRKQRDSKIKGSAESAKEQEELMMMGMDDSKVSVKAYDPNEWGADKPDERYAFVHEGEWFPAKDLEHWQRRVQRKQEDMTGQHPLVKALFRGFAVHSNSVDKSYRDLVEIMFRGRHLKFVIATEELGLGVNMPCRTTVFAFTTVQLNPLNYRQMSGRAGRRGFDDKGQVIFFGIDPRSACRLMTSSLSTLKGHFHLSCAAVLRLVLKFFFVKDSNGGNLAKPNVALQDQAQVLSKSFYAYSQANPDVTKLELLHHFRLCISYFQYLRLFPAGKPSSLAYLLSATAQQSDGAFIFADLLRSGLVDKLCADADKGEKQKQATLINIMTLLASLFFPIQVRSNAKRTDFNASAGRVVLPSLASISTEVAAAVKTHDKFVKTLLQQHSAALAATRHTYAAAADKLLEEKLVHLPVSGKVTTSSGQDASGSSASVAPELEKAAIAGGAAVLSPKTRSPFVAMAGLGDAYASAHDVIESVRDDLHVNEQQLPLSFSERTPSALFNAYALDFFANPDYYYEVIRTNGIDKSRAWETLQKFDKLLKMLYLSLDLMTREQSDMAADSDSEDDDGPSATSSSASSSSAATKSTPAGVSVVEKRTAQTFKSVYNRFHEHFESISRDLSKEAGSA